MPTFKVKNLSVTLGDAEQVQAKQYCLFPTCHTISCPGASVFCHWPTCHWISCRWLSCNFHSVPTGCGIFNSPCATLSPCGGFTEPGTCGLAHSTLPPTTFDTLTHVIKQVEDPAILETLRGQMDEIISAVKDRGVEIEKGYGPRSLKDAETLERELKAALAEVQKMKKGLK